MTTILRVVVTICLMIPLFAQAQVTIEGYAYQEGNRGFLYRVAVAAMAADGTAMGEALTDNDGFFSLELPAGKEYILLGRKEVFEDIEVPVSTVGKKDGDKVFVKIEMLRAPGYTFEITLAEQRDDINTPVDAIRGALIEVYNNTKKEETLVLKDHPDPDFKLVMTKGNHYTILIRNQGFLAKRMEAFVNVKGCILCFEGVGKVEPGVADNLTEGNNMGNLLANVELEKIVEGKTFPINNLYYDYGKATLKEEAIAELDKVINIFKDNPDLLLELGSHTDSRGKSAKNMGLSERRAQSAVNYLINNGDVPRRNIIAKGYGETKLINGCNNSADCTEKQHALNRRSELKIIGVLSSQGAQKSLAELKEQEQMDQLLQELMNQEQVQVNEGETLEDAIGTTPEKPIVEKEVKEEEVVPEEIELEDFDPKKIKADQRAAKKAKEAEEKRLKEEMEKREEMKRLEAERKKEEMEKKALEKAEKEAMEAEKEAARLAAIEEAKVKEAQAKEEAMKKQAAIEAEKKMEEAKMAEEKMAKEKIELESNQKESIEGVSEMDQDIKSDSADLVESVMDEKTEDIEIKEAGAEDTVEAEIETAVEEKDPSEYDMPGGTHSIVIHFTYQPLPEDHTIYQKHGNVKLFKGVNKELLYIIGEFQKREEADKFLKSYLQDEYPNAYIIGLKEGKRYY